jgi:predicted CXXCH cytochrome family protein
VLALVFGSTYSRAGSVVGSKHDISYSGFDPYSDQVCAFCHTPHTANPTVPAPLWNRQTDVAKPYTLYSCATMNTVPGAPNSTISIACLSCHDGTISYFTSFNGYSVNDKHELVNAPGPGGIPDMSSYPNCERCHADIFGTGQPMVSVGTNLADDHPISMTYPTAAQDPFFNLPPDLSKGWPNVPLFAGRVECPTCHKVHDPDNVPFLRVPNTASQLCITCHLK